MPIIQEKYERTLYAPNAYEQQTAVVSGAEQHQSPILRAIARLDRSIGQMKLSDLSAEGSSLCC